MGTIFSSNENSNAIAQRKDEFEEKQISQLKDELKENKRLKEENERLKEENERLKEENKLLKERVARLEERIARLEESLERTNLQLATREMVAEDLECDKNILEEDRFRKLYKNRYIVRHIIRTLNNTALHRCQSNVSRFRFPEQ